MGDRVYRRENNTLQAKRRCQFRYLDQRRCLRRAIRQDCYHFVLRWIMRQRNECFDLLLQFVFVAQVHQRFMQLSQLLVVLVGRLLLAQESNRLMDRSVKDHSKPLGIHALTAVRKDLQQRIVLLQRETLCRQGRGISSHAPSLSPSSSMR